MYDDQFDRRPGPDPEQRPDEPLRAEEPAAPQEPVSPDELTGPQEQAGPKEPVSAAGAPAGAEEAAAPPADESDARPELELPEIPASAPPAPMAPLYDPPRFEPREKQSGRGRGWRLVAAAVALVMLSAAVASGSTYYLMKEHLAAQPANYQQPLPSAPLQPVAQSVAEIGASVIPEIYRRVSPAVVSIEVVAGRGFYRTTGAGSGFVVDPEGYILTNYHVVENAWRITVKFVDGATMDAQVVGTDRTSDLAVLKVDPGDKQLIAAVLGDSDQVQVGELAIAIGNPYGNEFTVTAGIVSAVGREIVEPTTSIPGAIQTDAAINPGNSGGPLLNSRGEVIGVNTAIQTPSQFSGNVGLGFAVPINTAKAILPTLMAGESVKRPWLGVEIATVDDWYARVLGLDRTEGAVVVQVIPGTAAAEAGLRSAEYDQLNRLVSADVIIALDGQKVTSSDDLRNRIMQEYKVGDEIELTVIRDGQELTLRATLTARPDNQ